MCRPIPVISRIDEGYSELLSIWNQYSPRVYISVVLCFPADDRLRAETIRHIATSVQRLSQSRPLFAARLFASSPGYVSIHRSPSYLIPFEVCPSDVEVRQTYQQMKNEGFPPSLFIDPRYGPPGNPERTPEMLPVSRVRVQFVEGGLLLSAFLHHAVIDGESLGIFLECLAAQTQHGSIDRPSEQKIALTAPKHYKDPSELRAQFQRLAAKCPEFTLLSDLSGPTQPRLLRVGTPLHEIDRTGRIFVFSNARLEALRRLVTSHTSSASSSPTLRTTCYCALAALTFAHVTRARVGTERHLSAGRCSSGSMEPPGRKTTTTAQLWNSVNWRTRAFRDATRDYFGNAALPAVTEVSVDRLFAACEDDNELARIVPLIRETIGGIDQAYVHRRLAMLAAAPDPRLIGVAYDPRIPEVLAFNTWRHFGADAAWHIPGIPVAKPDAIRRAHGSWGMGTALILPAQAESTKQELFLSLSVEAMEALCNDERWMRWVDRVIG